MNRKGQALVEFVLILPIFLILLLAIVDFGMIISKKNELENVSVDVVSMVRNNNSVEDIKMLYPNVNIEINSDNGYTIVKIYSEMDIMTPGLNLVLGDPYEVYIERTIPNV